jgi:UPF0176 protein
MRILNLSSYQFATLEKTAEWRPHVLARCNELDLRGTILLAPEGINLFVAGDEPNVRAFMDYVRTDPLFEGKFATLQFKESFSEDRPFNRMLVRLKREIITMKKPAIRPEEGRAPSVAPVVLKAWLDRGFDDEGRPVVMLDTRNDFEIDVGTFDQALDYRLTKFSEFPGVIEANRADLEGKTVVSFCTGGIRCEKAAIHMKEVGHSQVLRGSGRRALQRRLLRVRPAHRAEPAARTHRQGAVLRVPRRGVGRRTGFAAVRNRQELPGVPSVARASFGRRCGTRCITGA